MKVTVNGKSQTYNQNEIVLHQLLKENNVTKPELVTIQINGNFINRDSYIETRIKDNDEVEFLYFMGGGETFLTNK